MTLTNTTELEAINRMLRVIGESPASSLAALPDDAISARAVLADVTREVLTEEWEFNRDYEYPLTASATAPYHLTIPLGAVRVTPSRCDAWRDLVVRAGKLYDRKNRTYALQGVVVKCDIVWLFDFSELPEQLRQYITVRAGRQFSDNDLQSQLIHGMTETAELMARAKWEAEDLRLSRTNMLRDSADMRRILDREAG